MRRVFITGGSRGIGKAIATRFEQAGYEVTCPSRGELDLSDDNSVEKYLRDHSSDVYDVVVNNAGINEINEIDKITDEEIDSMLRINLIAPAKLLRCFVTQMKKSGYGRIVNIGSVWAVVSKPGRGIYSASKNGLHGLTNTIALELAKYNILVNTVCPGFTITELTKKNNSDKEIKEISDQIPLGRMAEPYEIAEVVYFLGSEKNTYLTGQKIVVDGGYTVK